MAAEAYIAVHGGAGVHSQRQESNIKRALKLACKQALVSDNGIANYPGSSRKDNTVHLDMVENAIATLEDDVHFNAGYGSNLTLDGTVECDAAIMDGNSADFGSVGAVSDTGINNPIRLAHSILEYSRTPDSLGRIAPLSLVSEGARIFATRHLPYIKILPPEQLKSEGAEAEWKKWKNQMEIFGGYGGAVGPGEMQDTVGAVSWYPKAGIAAGVSSGGILLKYPGRIGEAAVFGAGCWAQRLSEERMGIACSVSGAGEFITRAALARTIGESFASRVSQGADLDPHDILLKVLTDNFWEPSRRRGVSHPSVGVLLLTSELNDLGNCRARLWCAFTTPSMAIGYASLKNPKPKAVVLRQPVDVGNSSAPPIFISAFSL